MLIYYNGLGFTAIVQVLLYNLIRFVLFTLYFGNLITIKVYTKWKRKKKKLITTQNFKLFLSYIIFID